MANSSFSSSSKNTQIITWIEGDVAYNIIKKNQKTFFKNWKPKQKIKQMFVTIRGKSYLRYIIDVGTPIPNYKKKGCDYPVEHIYEINPPLPMLQYGIFVPGKYTYCDAYPTWGIIKEKISTKQLY